MTLRGIFRNNFIKCADMPCGVCECVVEGWLHERVLCGWKDRWRVLAVHTEASGENKVNQIRPCRAPIVSIDAARPRLRGEVPPQWSWPVKEDTGGCWGCLEAPVHTHRAHCTQEAVDSNLYIQGSTATASKQNLRAGSCRACRACTMFMHRYGARMQ